MTNGSTIVVWQKANLFLQALVTVVAVSAHHRSGTFQGNSVSATTGSATNMTGWFAQVCVQKQHCSSKHPLVCWQISLWRILRFCDVAAVWLDSSVRLLGWAVQSVGSCCFLLVLLFNGKEALERVKVFLKSLEELTSQC